MQEDSNQKDPRIHSELEKALVNGSWRNFVMLYLDGDFKSRTLEVDLEEPHYFWALFRKVMDDWRGTFDVIDAEKPSWSDFATYMWSMPRIPSENKRYVIRAFLEARFQYFINRSFTEMSAACIGNLFNDIYHNVFGHQTLSEFDFKYRFVEYLFSQSTAEQAQIMCWAKSVFEACFVQALQRRYTMNHDLPMNDFYDMIRSIFMRTPNFFKAIFAQQPYNLNENLSPANTFAFLDDYCLFSLHPYNWTDNPIQVLSHLQEIRNQLQSWSRVFALDDNRVVKFSDSGLLQETFVMELIRSKTDIPVPQVIMTFVDDDQVYLVMTPIAGETLSSKIHDMSPEQLITVARELAKHINTIQQLGVPSEPAPSRLIGAWLGGPLQNIVFDPAPCLPFQSNTDFRLYWEQRLKESRQIKMPESYKVVLAHGDLDTQNIMLQDGHIVGIIDWDTFGWYPDFWDVMMAVKRTRHTMPEYVNAILEELKTPDTEDLERAIDEALF
ncbi:hypothetical protein VKT23_007947 [Stygiomarasmius scandens]|uniref:Aminoglycoside phosphotransferase domain-containing protein n=1 Tax=Marasmiellus scandens TaxID=2682957 RepID=A0ABR1JIV8_9AGAR